MQELHFILERIRIVIFMRVRDDYFAIGGAILQNRHQRAVEFGSSAQTRNDDRKPRHGKARQRVAAWESALRLGAGWSGKRTASSQRVGFDRLEPATLSLIFGACGLWRLSNLPGYVRQ